MKKTVVVFAVLLTFVSCVDQKSSEVVFTMINDTDKNIVVMGFNSQLNPSISKAENIYLEPNSDYKVSRLSGIDFDARTFYSLEGVDYIRVVFNDERVKIYTFDEVAGTPDVSIFYGDNNYQHIITEEDYNTAQDCNGDCEAVE